MEISFKNQDNYQALLHSVFLISKECRKFNMERMEELDPTGVSVGKVKELICGKGGTSSAASMLIEHYGLVTGGEKAQTMSLEGLERYLGNLSGVRYLANYSLNNALMDPETANRILNRVKRVNDFLLDMEMYGQ